MNRISNTEQPALECQNLSFRYRQKGPWVLDGCGLTLRYGEIVLLRGDSGTGKSTLLALLCGQLPARVGEGAAGEILLEGEMLYPHSAAGAAGHVGLLPQQAGGRRLRGRVEDEIALGLAEAGLPLTEQKQHTFDLCAVLSLQPHWEAGALSGGQRQRLCIARLLATGRKILLLDEPLANLDAESAHTLLNILAHLAGRGYAILMAGQRLEPALHWAHRVLELRNGRVAPTAPNPDAPLLYWVPQNSAADGAEKELLRLCSASFRVENRDILRDISLSLHAGQRLVVLGAAGSGKSTLLRVLAGLIEPTDGTAVRTPVPGWARRQRQKSAYLCQNPGRLSPISGVAAKLALYTAGLGQAKQYLRAFALKALGGWPPAALSEGERRRLDIAIAAARRPALLLLDEPTLWQDRRNLSLVVSALHILQLKYGTALVAATHDRACAEALAGRVLWLHEGRIHRLGGRELIEDFFGRAQPDLLPESK